MALATIKQLYQFKLCQYVKLTNKKIECYTKLNIIQLKIKNGRRIMENRIQINTLVSLSVDMIGRLECEPNWVGKEHSHHFWEIIIISDDMKTFDISLMMPNEPHCFHNNSNSVTHILYISFRFEGSVDAKTVREKILKKLQDPKYYDKYASFFDIMEKYGSKDNNKRIILSQVFVFLTEALGEYMIESGEDEHHSIVAEIKKYISLNIDKQLTVKEIASTLYLSPKYIGNVFKKKTGMGILQYQNARKMEEALIFLKGGKLTISEIASALGFETVAYFSNTFKAYYGLSPINFAKIQDRKNL